MNVSLVGYPPHEPSTTDLRVQGREGWSDVPSLTVETLLVSCSRRSSQGKRFLCESSPVVENFGLRTFPHLYI